MQHKQEVRQKEEMPKALPKDLQLVPHDIVASNLPNMPNHHMSNLPNHNMPNNSNPSDLSTNCGNTSINFGTTSASNWYATMSRPILKYVT